MRRRKEKMAYSLKPENRDFIRINTELLCEFKFLGQEMDLPGLDKTAKGIISSLSAGGMLLEGPIPDMTWIPLLIMRKFVVGVKLELPGYEEPVMALCRAAWIDRANKKSKTEHTAVFGLEFKEVSSGDKDRVLDYVIRQLMD